jgi:hypothetical protein
MNEEQKSMLLLKFATWLVRAHAHNGPVTEWRDRPSDITRYTVPLGANVTLLDSARFNAVVRGSEKPATVASASNG